MIAAARVSRLVVLFALVMAGACGSPGSGVAPGVPRCGDLACNGAETCATCGSDCGACNVAYCGNGACDGDELCATCSNDCGTCPTAACGDGSCGAGETCQGCPGDCGFCDLADCGDGTCEAGESCANCQGDCGACPILCGIAVCDVGETCTAGTCTAPCQVDCVSRSCGDDGCGGSCGTCAAGVCQSGQCVTTCAPDCTGKACGDDGCGGSCGACAGVCQSGQCVTTCAPDCTGKSCGDDGCGGSCGPCAGVCQSGQCVTTCAPDCTGKVCGDNGCGGACGTCGASETCTAGRCQPGACVPSCIGKACGADDGCGAACGCGATEVCVAGTCRGEGDPCGAVTVDGCCARDQALFVCNAGELVRLDCAATGGVCTKDSGQAGCSLFTNPPDGGDFGQCPGEPCDDTCAGRECGWACGVSCGACSGGDICAAGQCVADRCVGITFEGCCFGPEMAVWCQDGQLEQTVCTDGCGWAGAQGYNCGGSGADPSGVLRADGCDIGAGPPTRAPAAAGELVVSELMANPDAVSDANGEWFEVQNRTSATLALKGLVVESGNDSFTVTATVQVGPGRYAVFARKADPAVNGGAPVLFGWGAGGLDLTNTADSIRLVMNGIEIDQVAYGAGWTVPNGKSLSLRSQALTLGHNDAPADWCVARTAMSGGDLGTPGAANDCE